MRHSAPGFADPIFGRTEPKNAKYTMQAIHALRSGKALCEMEAKTAPALNVPPSDSTVKISAIDSTLNLVGVACDVLWNPPIKGFDKVTCGTWSFLIEHPSGRKLLYDLGCRKDWKNLAPALKLQDLVDNGTLDTLDIEKNVSEILTEGGVELEDIEGVIWSHW